MAIHLGHRESVDLDFFTEKDFDIETIKHKLANKGGYKIDTELSHTLDGTLDGVRVSLFHNPHKPLFPLKEYSGISLADERDVAAMKINAISGRGSKKDFIDLYFLLKSYSINELIGFFEDMYSDVEYNKTHLIKSLSYFEKADSEPSPKMLKNVSWSDVKKEIRDQVQKLL